VQDFYDFSCHPPIQAEIDNAFDVPRDADEHRQVFGREPILAHLSSQVDYVDAEVRLNDPGRRPQ
jgi:hypothetical protein